MTVQQEAINMINSMPDDAVVILVELLKGITVNDSHFEGQAAEGLQMRPSKRRIGIADGKYNIPDNIDACNDEIAKMFGVAE